MTPRRPLTPLPPQGDLGDAALVLLGVLMPAGAITTFLLMKLLLGW